MSVHLKKPDQNFLVELLYFFEPLVGSYLEIIK
jgi:hypothetical protein